MTAITAKRAILLAGLAGSALVPSGLAAQDLQREWEDDERAEAIVVTGSRIERTGYTSPVPLTVVDEAQIRTSGQTQIGDILRQVPSITAGLDSANGNRNLDAGAGFVNLRGLGTNRSLTLVNGRRRVSGSSTSSAVDVNTIPAAMVERMEITTGGASAIYGADAVSGVVNIITRKDFEGLEVSAQGGISERGDAENYAISFYSGTRFLDGRGSINFAGSYGETAPLQFRDRPFTREPLSRWPNPANTGPDDGIPDTLVYRNIEGDILVPDANFHLMGRSWFYMNNELVAASPTTVVRTGEFLDGIAMPGRANLGEQLLRLPSEVFSLRSDLTYELARGLEFFAEGEFTMTNTSAHQEYYRFDHRDFWFDGRGGPRIQHDNVFLPAPVAALMDEAGVTEIGVRRRLVDELGVITDHHGRQTYSVVLGFKGEIFDNWRWNVSYQYGQADDHIQTDNLLYGENFLNAVDAIVDPATGEPACRDAAARAAGCVPYNIFVRGPLTQAQRDYFVRTRNQYTRNLQEIFGAHLNGGLFNLPAGTVLVAAGVEHRREGLRTQDDAAMLSGDIKWGVGTQATPRTPLDEKFEVTEGYAELSVPLISGLSVIDLLTVDGAVRLSDYNTIGSTVAWQGGANWHVNEDIRLRFTRSRSVRAPNLLELFGPTSVTMTSIANPCSSANINISANRRANCMAVGNPATGGQQTIPSIASITGGNRNLTEETSNSLTIGAVVTPSVVPRLRLSVDYYDINITNVVSSFGSGDVFRGCLEANSMSGNPFCRSITFRPNGDVETLYSGLINAAGFTSSGIDFAADYRLPTGSTGSIGLNLVGTYLLKKEFLGVADDRNTAAIQDGGFANPRLRLNLTASYDNAQWGVSVLNRFFSKSVLDPRALPEAVEDGDVPFRIYTDIVLRYNISEKMSGYLGVNNALAIKPPMFPETYSYGSFYDNIGRFFHAGVKVGF